MVTVSDMISTFPLSVPVCLSLLWRVLTTRSRSFLSHHMSALGLSRKSRLFSKTSSISEEPPAAGRSVQGPSSELLSVSLSVCLYYLFCFRSHDALTFDLLCEGAADCHYI